MAGRGQGSGVGGLGTGGGRRRDGAVQLGGDGRTVPGVQRTAQGAQSGDTGTPVRGASGHRSLQGRRSGKCATV